jgi:hypothetical protein
MSARRDRDRRRGARPHVAGCDEVGTEAGEDVGPPRALIGMGPGEPTDHAAAFTEALLRAGYMLSGLAADLVEASPSDAYPREEPGAVVIEMVVGTIGTAFSSADQRDLQRATELIATACDRVLEHLQLALDVSRRMEGGREGGTSRTYG